MIILAVLSENTVQCPKTLLLCLLYIYTFPIASFCVFVQWIDLGSENPLQLAHSGYKDTKIFGTKVWGGSFDFNINIESKMLLFFPLSLGKKCKLLLTVVIFNVEKMSKKDLVSSLALIDFWLTENYYC